MDLVIIQVFFLGVFGQFIRSIIGIRKQLVHASETGEDFQNWFDWKLFILSLLIGGIAGVIGYTALSLMELEIPSITIIAMGYAGTDLLEGILKPKANKLLEKGNQQNR